MKFVDSNKQWPQRNCNSANLGSSFNQGAQGITFPAKAIKVGDTWGTTLDLGKIMSKFGMKSCIVVSDGYHIFHVKRVLENRGFTVYGSPRPERNKDEGWRQDWLHYRQAIAYGLWRIGINI